jgi:LysM repeat protein
MTVRSKIIAALALGAALFGAGCGGGESAPLSVETDEPNYRQGQQLVREGRDAEALSMFLKVIERRGEQAAAESHLEAGLILLNHAKNPIEAIHHFQIYLELQPNAKQAPSVRGLIETARREFARTLPGHPLESQAVGIDQSDQIKTLQHEVDDLKAENTALRALAPGPALRISHAAVDAPETPLIKPDAPPAASAPIRLQVSESPRAAIVTPPPKPALFTTTPTTKSGSAAPSVRTGPVTPSAGRNHVIVQGDTLYNVAKKYGVKMEDIVAANRDLLPSVASPLRKGMELKIP